MVPGDDPCAAGESAARLVLRETALGPVVTRRTSPRMTHACSVRAAPTAAGAT